MAASLAYYTVFSLPPLLLVAVAVAGLAFERPTVVSTIYQEVDRTLGRHAADQVLAALAAAQDSSARSGMGGAILSVLLLMFSATGAFIQLQAALNRIWEVKPDDGEIRSFLLKRVVSFGMVISLGFLLMVSLLLSAALAAFSTLLEAFLPPGLSTTFLAAFSHAVSLLIFAVLFAAVFRFLPDSKLDWDDVAIGGLITSVLFVGGRFAIGLYLASSDITSAFGAAASLAIILAWTYYASMTVLLGAEFTKMWSLYSGRVPDPEEGAVRVKQREVRIP